MAEVECVVTRAIIDRICTEPPVIKVIQVVIVSSHQGIVARNERMVQTVLPYLSEDSVFIAVGALHLPGEDGLVSLLRSRGYRLTPLALPFLSSEQGRQSNQDSDHE